MITQLHEKFHDYLTGHHPELILDLSPQFNLNQYIQEKLAGITQYLDQLIRLNTPPFEMITLCMDRLTADLRPSRYLYLKEILEEEFTGDHLVMQEAGTLTYELVNLITACSPIFKHFGFSEETESGRILRYAIIGQIREYLSATSI